MHALVDLKSPYPLGHSRAVAQLARDASPILGLDTATGQLAYRAALVHGLGRLGVSNAIWASAVRSVPASGSGCGSSPT